MPLTKINFSTAAAETIGKLPDSSKVTNIDNNTRFLVVEDEETKYTLLNDITSGVSSDISTINSNIIRINSEISNLRVVDEKINDIIQGGMEYFSKEENIWGAINDDEDTTFQTGNSVAKNVREIKSAATSHAGTFASTTIAGHVKLSQSGTIGDSEAAPVGFNASNQLVVRIAQGTSTYGTAKASTLATNGNSLGVISIVNGAYNLKVRNEYSGFNVVNGALYIQTSESDTHPTADDITTGSVATDTNGRLAVPAASSTKAGAVILGTDTQITTNSAVVGINADNKLAVENASATAYGVVKLSTDNPLSTASAPIGKTSDGQIVVPMATMSTYGTVKKSSESGTSKSCIGINSNGQLVLNVRQEHSGFDTTTYNTIYVNTSTDEHPTNGAETTAPVGTDTAGKLAVPAATTAKAGGVLLATAETDERINAVPTIAQFKALLDRVAALETALASVTLVTAPETTTT